MLLLAFIAGLLSAPNPRTLVDRAIAAMRGTGSVHEVTSLRLTGLQHEFALGNAERAEGPWRVSYSQFTELRDHSRHALRRTERAVSPAGTFGAERVTVLADSVAATWSGGRETGSSHAALDDALDRIEGSPERALQLAAASSKLNYERAVTRFGLSFDVVSFPWHGGRTKIEINPDSHLPEAVVIVREYPDNFRWAPFGTNTMRSEYLDWTVQSSGMYWPMQTKVSLNGEPLRDITLASVAIDSAAGPEAFVISDSARAQYGSNSGLNFSKLRLGDRGQPTELAPGIVRVPDFWTMTLVKQPDGVVIFESHISAQYLHDIIDEVHKRWPGSPVKAIVMTSDPWAHLGGLHEAARLSIPIYVNARSIPFLSKIAKDPRAKFVAVNGKISIGTGDNAIQLFPVGGPYAERMTMAYFPRRKLLYGADLVFPNRGPDGKFSRGFLVTPMVDLRRAVEREHLVVDTVFCVQNYPGFSWSDFSSEN